MVAVCIETFLPGTMPRGPPRALNPTAQTLNVFATLRAQCKAAFGRRWCISAQCVVAAALWHRNSRRTDVKNPMHGLEINAQFPTRYEFALPPKGNPTNRKALERIADNVHVSYFWQTVASRDLPKIYSRN
jgi:hypothetical protein